MRMIIGDKIKELRKRDGRKQEDLASALGVTCQAISRWESNKGYPDMEMIPSIANYFHITIDELFGYDNNRDVKLNGIIEQADSMCNPRNKQTPKSIDNAEAFLRNALSEFPNEWKLQFRLSVVLQMKAALPKIGSQVRKLALEESAALLEQAIASTDDSGRKDSMVYSLICLHSLLGNSDSIELLASESLPLYLSREIIKTHTPNKEAKNKAFGEAVAGLIHELAQTMDRDYRENPESASSSNPELINSIIKLNDCIYEQSNNPVFNSDACILHLHSARIHAKKGNEKAVLKHFDSAHKHYLSFIDSWDKNETTAVELPNLFTYINENTLKERVNTLPRVTADKIRNNPRYKEIFK